MVPTTGAFSSFLLGPTRQRKLTPTLFGGVQVGKARTSPSQVVQMAPTNSSVVIDRPSSRFDRTAEREMKVDEECLLEIDGKRYNLTAWAKAHPGGVNVLRKFHNKDASKAFHVAAHSDAAYAMLKNFLIVDDAKEENLDSSDASTQSTSRRNHESFSGPTTMASPTRKRPRWQQKLFTNEDPIGVHKYLGIFCLLNFAYRFGHMYFGDPTAGLGSSTKSFWPILSMVPHALLSLSSLIFHTVPRERVVGKPMIWKEFRIHNIAFGLRSVICGVLAWLSVRYSPRYPALRQVAVVGSGLTALATIMVADLGTRHLQPSKIESTTATMPYWEGCSVATQKRFKTFYAYSQFMATLACLAVCNPAWPLAVLLAIQSASLFMTLVRKGILSAKGYHIAYTITLVMPYLVALRHGFVMGHWFFPSILTLAAFLFSLRRMGVSKYELWVPVVAARILVGDRVIPFDVW
ncbi:hypothetical protein ACA910_013337 [Epithemia clementina (nom. ined.)]